MSDTVWDDMDHIFEQVPSPGQAAEESGDEDIWGDSEVFENWATQQEQVSQNRSSSQSEDIWCDSEIFENVSTPVENNEAQATENEPFEADDESIWKDSEIFQGISTPSLEERQMSPSQASANDQLDTEILNPAVPEGGQGVPESQRTESSGTESVSSFASQPGKLSRSCPFLFTQAIDKDDDSEPDEVTDGGNLEGFIATNESEPQESSPTFYRLFETNELAEEELDDYEMEELLTRRHKNTPLTGEDAYQLDDFCVKDVTPDTTSKKKRKKNSKTEMAQNIITDGNQIPGPSKPIKLSKKRPNVIYSDDSD